MKRPVIDPSPLEIQSALALVGQLAWLAVVLVLAVNGSIAGLISSVVAAFMIGWGTEMPARSTWRRL